MYLGNRIITKFNRPPKELVEDFRGIAVSNIGDMMNRLFCMDRHIKAMTRRPMVGIAVTVNAPEGDNAFLHRAMDIAKPGDVIVVNGHGCETRALMGEIMLTYAQKRGIEGFIIDGAVRDSEAFDKLNISVYARAVTPQGPYKNGPGEINVPIACGGLVIFPGDIVVGDQDGVCIIPATEAHTILELAKRKADEEENILNNYRNGDLNEDGHKKKYITVTDQIGTFYDLRK